MPDITIHALYGSVVEDEDQLFVGFAAGEDEDEGYVLFRQPVGGGPVWFEVNDESFGAEDAVEAVIPGPKGLEIVLRPALAPAFGWARTVAVTIGPDCEDAAPAMQALQEMLGTVWRTQV
jgi:hypothetical protein